MRSNASSSDAERRLRRSAASTLAWNVGSASDRDPLGERQVGDLAVHAGCVSSGLQRALEAEQQADGARRDLRASSASAVGVRLRRAGRAGAR